MPRHGGQRDGAADGAGRKARELREFLGGDGRHQAEDDVPARVEAEAAQHLSCLIQREMFGFGLANFSSMDFWVGIKVWYGYICLHNYFFGTKLCFYSVSLDTQTCSCSNLL